MAYERTWAQSLNNAQTPATALEETQRELWSLKAMILGQYGGLTLGLWSTYYSCNSLTAGAPNDGVDRWGSTFTAVNIVRGIAGAAHSWYVLKSPVMGGQTFYLLISFDGSSDTAASLFMSRAPFTGGTTTANPTSTDSWTVVSNAAWNGASTAVHRFNLILTSTGDFVWFVIKDGTHVAELCVMAISPTGCDPNDGYPIMSLFKFNGSSGVNTSGGFDNQGITGAGTATRNFFGATATAVAWCMQRAVSGSGLLYDSLTGSQLDQPIWILVFTTSPNVWHHRGRLPDMAMSWINSNAQVATNGDVVNPGGGVIAVQMGAYLLPLTAAPDLT